MRSLFIVAILFLIIVNASYSTNYYVDNISGNNSNSGLSSSAAWQTLAVVNSFAFSPGDSILFNRGGVWRGQLTPKSGSAAGAITYAAYGTGAKPLLLGSVNVGSTSDWISLGGNIWQSVQASTIDIGNLIFNGATTVGVKKWSAAALVNQGDFWWDASTTHKVQMYSTGNPALFYSSIEAAVGNFIIYIQGGAYVTIKNLALKYGAADGIEVRNSHHVTIEDCDLSFIGGSALTGQVRYGGGIQFWANSHDNRVQRCRIWEIYDDALTNQGNVSAGGTVQQYNLFYINNIMWNCSESSFCFYIQPAVVNGSFMKNIHFENNTCVNAGGGWAAAQRPDRKGFQVYCSQNTAATDSIFIRNNIFSKSRSFIFVDNQSVQTWAHTTSDYNCWYTQNNTDSVAVFWTPTALTFYTASNFSAYKSKNNEDAHSLLTDPLFVNALTNDYSLAPSSPCINSGTNTGVVSDYYLTPRPQSGAYDIGAYEFKGTTVGGIKSTDPEIHIYPNPSNGRFTISRVDPKNEIRIYNSFGKLVYEDVGYTELALVDLSGQPNGIYFLKTLGYSKKIVIVNAEHH